MKKILMHVVLLGILTLMSLAYATNAEITPTPDDSLTDETAVTAELAKSIGISKALGIISDLKALLKDSKAMSDETLRTEISRIAEGHETELTEKQTELLLSLCRCLEKLNSEEIKVKADNVKDTVKRLTEEGKPYTSFAESAKDFFQGILDFFRNLFKTFA